MGTTDAAAKAADGSRRADISRVVAPVWLSLRGPTLSYFRCRSYLASTWPIRRRLRRRHGACCNVSSPRSYALLPIAMPTAKADLKDATRGLMLGADGYVPKSYGPNTLDYFLRYVFGQEARTRHAVR